MTFSIPTLSIKSFYGTLSITMLCHHYECHYAECHYAECHYAECHYAECRGAQKMALNIGMEIFFEDKVSLTALPSKMMNG